MLKFLICINKASSWKAAKIQLWSISGFASADASTLQASVNSEDMIMNIWQEFLKDPVIFFSFTGLALVIGLCLFYAGYFLYKTSHAE